MMTHSKTQTPKTGIYAFAVAFVSKWLKSWVRRELNDNPLVYDTQAYTEKLARALVTGLLVVSGIIVFAVLLYGTLSWLIVNGYL